MIGMRGVCEVSVLFSSFRRFFFCVGSCCPVVSVWSVLVFFFFCYCGGQFVPFCWWGCE